MPGQIDRWVYRFGPFTLDPERRRLSHGSDPVWLPDRQMDVLLLLVADAQRVVAKDVLVDAAWGGLAITDNSIVQTVRRLRQTLGSQPDGSPYIDTLPRQGYRFAAVVERVPLPPAVPDMAARRPGAVSAASGAIGTRVAASGGIAAQLEPYRAFVEGRAALETLDRAAIARASQAFAEALRGEPAFAGANVGMANVHLLAFEATRAEAAPELAALAQAERHAREGCRLDPTSGDAWSTLAVVLQRRQPIGMPHEAVAAARKAVALEPHEWRHHLRLAVVGCGAERLRAAHRVLSLCPGLALAHWFAATVLVARDALDAAVEHLRAGCEAQDDQHRAGSRFSAVGLHLLYGLVLAARGEPDRARAEWGSELTFEGSGHIYASECCGHTWAAIGGMALKQGCREEAVEAFQHAVARVPNHPLAAAGLAAALDPANAAVEWPPADDHPADIDRAIARAAVLVLHGRHAAAARLCEEALVRTDAGDTGWRIPVEPLLDAAAHRRAWARTLAVLRARAL